MTFRSTKGASKQRRDQINALVTQLRSLLPLHESTRQRLSQLQVMSLLCVHIRKNLHFPSVDCNEGAACVSDELQEHILKALPGFLLVIKKDGKLLHVSDNVTDYLGHSMVDMMTQGDSFYDIVDDRDHCQVQTKLDKGWNQRFTQDAGVTFFCRMNVARTLRRPCNFREQKVMVVRGGFSSLGLDADDQEMFVGMCTPLLTPEVKQSVYQTCTDLVWFEQGYDMKLTACSPLVAELLGYDGSELMGKSWYELLHPTDLKTTAEMHKLVMKLGAEQGVMMTARLQSAAGTWLNSSVTLTQHFEQDGSRKIVAVHSFISEDEEAEFRIQCEKYNNSVRLLPISSRPAVRPQGGANFTASQSPCEPILTGMVSDLVVVSEHISSDKKFPARSSGMSLKRKLIEPLTGVPSKLMKGYPGDSISQILTPKSAGAIDIDDILNLPTLKQEFVYNSPEASPVHSTAHWTPPSPPQSSNDSIAPPTVPLVSKRLLPQIGADEIINFFQVQEKRYIPTTLSALDEDSSFKQADQRSFSAQLFVANDVLSKQEVGTYNALEEVLSESESESHLDHIMDSPQLMIQDSLLNFLQDPLPSAPPMIQSY